MKQQYKIQEMLDHVCSLYNFEKQFSCYQTETQVVQELKRMISNQPVVGLQHSISELKDILPSNSIVLFYAGDKVHTYKKIEDYEQKRLKVQTFIIVQDVSQQSPQYYINQTESYIQL
ncbi:hypothetical protein pb186bvf_018020 [Paramecium bursaria]